MMGKGDKNQKLLKNKQYLLVVIASAYTNHQRGCSTFGPTLCYCDNYTHHLGKSKQSTFMGLLDVYRVMGLHWFVAILASEDPTTTFEIQSCCLQEYQHGPKQFISLKDFVGK